ncbi:MAG: class I SAM-dependent methyltransferase [Desulfobacterota bacterium]|nr:class I SAM-dependent methyltransferase [Thermodesulfobacteriota bacterium]
MMKKIYNCTSRLPMCSDEWEATYLRFIRVVANPKKFARVLQKWQLNPNARILDLCCGNGSGLDVFWNAGFRNVYGLDISRNFLRRVRKDVPVVLADAQACPIRSGSFDVVIIHKALHHFFDHAPVLAEVKRMLKPDGFFCFIEPRKTWFRTLYHIVLMSPVAELFPPLARMRQAALIEEGPTYFTWLDNADAFFTMLEQQFSFVVESRTDDIMHHIVKCRNLPHQYAAAAGHDEYEGLQ